MANARKTNPATLERLRKNQEIRRKAAEAVEVVRQNPAPIPEPQPVVETEPIKPKKLCVGSIFTNANDLCKKWLNLQLRYLRATVDFDFDHVSVCQTAQSDDVFGDEETKVLLPTSKPGTNSKAHVSGLNLLRDHFIHNQNYDSYLFLDMDAFPVRKGWYDILTKVMQTKYEIAIALRSENLEQRLHSSVLFTKPESLPKFRWGVSKVGKDLNGGTESDVHLMSHQTGELRDKSYVLLRSNKSQIHPLLCGVYYDLFYHHCCGSGRNFNMRARPYWSHVCDTKFDVMKTIDDLFANPNEFVGQFVGWDGIEYAKV